MTEKSDEKPAGDGRPAGGDKRAGEVKPAGDPARVAGLPPTADAAPPPPNLRWMGKSHQWGTRVQPNKHGLRLGDLNVGIYGEVPPVWTDQTRLPRGAVARRGVPPIGYALRDKVDLWADSAANMYEEAIQRRWAPATSIPWNTIEPLPDDVERAICQVCTELSQYANADVESVTYWQTQMAYGYHEVKQFLATVSFDGARHMEVFRKRALCNGGGLGLEGPGEVNRMILESRGGWTEAALYLFVMRGLFTQTLYRYLERYAHNDAERRIFAHCLEDKARHLTYGIDHLRYAITHQDDQNLIVTQLCIIGERVLVRELKDVVLREALAIVFGNGIGGADAGLNIHARMMTDYIRRYLATLKWLGVERTLLFPDELSAYLKAS